MRIAQVAPLYESVPPKLYGGTERVVSYLTEALVEMGHRVTLFASGDSETRAELVSCTPRALRLDPQCEDALARHVVQLDRVMRQAHHFDLIHWHIDYLHFPLSASRRYAHLTTLHGRLDIPDLGTVYRHYSGIPLVSISDAQRAPLPWANWAGTVYHGVPEHRFRFAPEPGKYLAFLGRISPEKGVDWAIRLAEATDIPIRIAAKIDPKDREYHRHIRPMFDSPLVEFLGEIGDEDKSEFLGNALGLVFLIDWPEPFGLAVIEALACGTPVVAYRRGSLPELLGAGRGGFLVDRFDEAVHAVDRLHLVDRRDCRRLFEERFTARRMAQDYVNLYHRILEQRSSHDPRPRTLSRLDRRPQRPVLHPGEVDAAG